MSDRRKLDYTSSGHRAGIHNAKEFSKTEKQLKRIRDEDLDSFNKQHSKHNNSTVYRDKYGKKLDIVDEYIKEQDNQLQKEKKKRVIEEAQQEWGKGTVQQKELELRQEELIKLANQPFARTVDDPELEFRRKQEIRVGDPMANYFSSRINQQQNMELEETIKKQQKKIKKGKLKTSSAVAKPLYKGPTPPPNRFGIMPGYRWDAIDRGNGFERRIMEKINSNMSFNEDKYKWSVSDL